MPTINTFLSAVGKRPILCGSLLLAAITILNNWPVSYFDFAWDDYGYVVRNYAIQDPVSFKTLWWCLTQFAEANWHPVTWFALNIEFNCFGLDPRGYHIVNLALHVANVILLYAALCRMTGASGKSLVVAALFAVHPVHVESVAWISEIKDVLSTFFLMLTLHAYISYARKPTLGRYAFTFGALVLGLMSKPMLVTAPFALLLLDYWPLGRWTMGPQPARPQAAPPRYETTPLLLEKLPFLALAVATCVLTFLAQREGGAVAGLGELPLSMRLANVTTSYILYVWRMLWPWPLSFFYPMTGIGMWRFIFSSLLLTTLFAIPFYLLRTKPYVLIGWLWFVGTLVPVIGFVQVGTQSFADRYTYIPSIGVLILAVWLAADLLGKLRQTSLLGPILAGAIIFAYMLVSFEYLGHWANEIELFQYAIAIDERNVVAQNNYGKILSTLGKPVEANRHFEIALRYKPHAVFPLNNLAINYFILGDHDAAFKAVDDAIENSPKYSGSYVNKAKFFLELHDYKKAEELLRQSLGLAPGNLNTILTLIKTLTQLSNLDEALSLANKTISTIHDNDPLKLNYLTSIGEILFKQHDIKHSTDTLYSVLQRKPDFLPAASLLATIYQQSGNFSQAVTTLRTAIKNSPGVGELHFCLGDLYLAQKHYGLAYVQYRRATALAPTSIEAHEELAVTLRHFSQYDAADIQAAKASDLRLLLRPRASTLPLSPTTSSKKDASATASDR